MSSGSIRCTYQDSAGYLWFGTLAGIDRYDGYSFTSYKHDPEDTASLVNQFVNAFCEDRAGNLWVGTSAGLDLLDRRSGKFTHYLPHPSEPGAKQGNFVNTIHEDRDGLLWIATDNGLNALDRASGKFTHFRDDSTDPGSDYISLRAICEDRKGLLWIGTDRGLDRFDKKSGRFIHYWHDFDKMKRRDNWINSICEDSSGILWLGGGAGLVAFDQRTMTFTQYAHDPRNAQSLSNNEVTSISEDQAGRLWVGTYGHGLNVFDRKTKQFTRYVHNSKDPRGLSSDGIQSVYCERSGTIWVATIDQGLNKLNGARPLFTCYPYDDQAPNTTVPQAFADNSGRIWVHASNEWKKFDPETETFVHQGLDRDLYPLLEDRAGNLWLAKQSGGLCKRDQHGHITTVCDSSGLRFRRVVMCFLETRDGRYWMGTEDGWFFAVYPARMSINPVLCVGTQINNIYEDTSGLLWLGTWDAGLFCFDPGRHKTVQYRYDPKNRASLNTNFVATVCEDKTGTLWVGTGQGLDRFDRTAGTFSHFTERDGLPSNVVCKIIEDDHGELWLGTGKGISMFDPRQIRFKNYDVSYGLADNSMRLQSGCRTANGEMYFGGKGLVRFHPDSLRDNPFIPPIVVTRFLLFEKAAPLSREVKLSYHDNSLSFEFAALSYVNSQRNTYAYMMEGLDKDWVYSGTRRYAAYPHLDPGEYVLRVRGANNDGVWNEEGTSIAIIITPPFWNTWWFKVLSFVVLLGTVGGSVRYFEMKKLKRKIERLEYERALERERSRISQDMHDEVGASLTEIAILSELARKEMGSGQDKAGPHIQRIADRSREVVDSMSEIIWTINPKNDQLVDLVAYLHHYATSFLKSTPIRFRFVSAEAVPNFTLSAEVRRQIFLVVKEALHNVAKHSRATETTVCCGFTERTLEVSVEDNGKGFQADELSRFGNGLLNMRKRIETIGGTFAIDSHQDGGTKIRIAVPIGVTKG